MYSSFIPSIRQLSILLALLALGCSSEDPEKEAEELDPAVLVFPEKEMRCNEGEEVNETQSRVTFRWQAAPWAKQYRLVAINLDGGYSPVEETSATELAVVIDRASNYEWYVVAIGTQNVSSERWRFFNEGPGRINRAPYPAEPIFPTRGLRLFDIDRVDFKWQGNDPDGEFDIVQYDVYLGIKGQQLELIGTNTIAEDQLNLEETIPNIRVDFGQIYQWQIKTTDRAGLSSLTETFEFSISAF